MIKLLYFARLREELNCGEESMELPEAVQTVRQLHAFLCNRDQQWSDTLQKPGLFIAVDHTVVDWDTPLKGSEEVGFFPPVTGG